ncbi:hypothetical protein PRIPAC_90792 [Pristionchus pacificus]|uniref:Uncharacterized protein n=1 Tax=Pristionchus pacificus TaxID=54126 RepID=A0A2A6B7T8_PRIPA|nr:hypothetical protein PRIPAC_90792 [Pristionchus pacificus]|eukprot:PDM61938.1 hypothetical protein PRIPAC_51380 [Pristionchus pacificus]
MAQAWYDDYPTSDHEKKDEHSQPAVVPQLKKEREYSIFTKCFAEFLGDVIFVFAGSMQGYINGSMDSILHAAFAHGLTIFILVTSLGHLVGGICGSLLTRAILSKQEFTAILGGATLLETDTNTWYQGLISESVVTFILVHTVLNAAMGSDDKVLAPLAVGFTLTIDIIATQMFFVSGRITGASMNPARSLGPNLVGWAFMDTIPDGWWEYHYIYWAGPIMGACAASAVYWLAVRATTQANRAINVVFGG